MSLQTKTCFQIIKKDNFFLSLLLLESHPGLCSCQWKIEKPVGSMFFRRDVCAFSLRWGHFIPLYNLIRFFMSAGFHGRMNEWCLSLRTYVGMCTRTSILLLHTTTRIIRLFLYFNTRSLAFTVLKKYRSVGSRVYYLGKHRLRLLVFFSHIQSSLVLVCFYVRVSIYMYHGVWRACNVVQQTQTWCDKQTDIHIRWYTSSWLGR